METRIRESVKECELMTKVLYEVLPIIRAQLKLEEYNSREFKTIDQKTSHKKREYLQTLLDSIIESK